jgi:MerR family transcriptional regulator, light-induced transcriptional regulator
MASPQVASAAGLAALTSLTEQAMEAVSSRFYREFADALASFGERGRSACREDIRYHLDFLAPAMEFGAAQSFVDYARWLQQLLRARKVPDAHLALSLKWLREFLAERMPPDDAALAAGILERAEAELATPTQDAAPQGTPSEWPECEPFTAAVLRGDRGEAVRLFQQAAGNGERFADAELHLLQPALYAAGEGWQRNEVSVAEEHVATAIVRELMASEYPRAQTVAPVGRRIAFACAEGNLHAVGLRIVADAFELVGWDTLYIGASTPTRSLVDLVARARPDVVALSVSLPPHFRPARDAIAALRAALGDRCPLVIVGGSAINRFPPLAQALGADLTALDGQQAVLAVEQRLNL